VNAKYSLSPKSNDRLQILFWNSNLHIQLLWFLMELDLAEFLSLSKDLQHIVMVKVLLLQMRKILGLGLVEIRVCDEKMHTKPLSRQALILSLL